MRKKIFSALLLSMLAFASTSTLVSCKDYDDDISANTTAINDLKGKLTELQTNLSSQISSLQTQLTTAKNELQTAIDKKADKTTVETLAGRVTTLEQQVGVLESKMKTVEEALKTKADKSDVEAKYLAVKGAADVDLEKINLKTLDAAIKENFRIQNEAIETAKGRITALETMLTDYPTVKAQVATNKANIEALTPKVNKAVEDITALTSRMTTAEGNISTLQTRVGELNTAINNVSTSVNALEILVSKRLTSMVFTPNYYLWGVEAIPFYTLEYEDWSNDAAKWLADEAATDQEYTINADDATASYLINPTLASLEGYEFDFVSDKAINLFTTRAQQQAAEPIVTVAKTEYKDGKLVVNIHKNTDKHFTSMSILNPGQTGQNQFSIGMTAFDIIALRAKLPAAALAKGEAETYVYSDWARLVESTETPYIHRAAPAAEFSQAGHFYRFTDIYTDAHLAEGTTANIKAKYSKELIDADIDIEKEVKYSDAIDLDTVVAVCVDEDEIDYKSYGMKFEFNLVEFNIKDEFETVEGICTDQSKYAKLTGSVLTSSGVTKTATEYKSTGVVNKAAIGRTPMIQAVLRDTANNRVVDVQYFRIQWVDPAKDVIEEIETTTPQKSTEVYDCVAPELKGIFNIEPYYTVLNMSNEEFRGLYGWAHEGKIYSSLQVKNGVPTGDVLGDAYVNWGVVGTMTSDQVEYKFDLLAVTGKQTEGEALDFIESKLLANNGKWTIEGYILLGSSSSAAPTKAIKVTMEVTHDLTQYAKAAYASGVNYIQGQWTWEGDLNTANKTKYVTSSVTPNEYNEGGPACVGRDIATAFIKNGMAFEASENTDELYNDATNDWVCIFDKDRLAELPSLSTVMPGYAWAIVEDSLVAKKGADYVVAAYMKYDMQIQLATTNDENGVKDNGNSVDKVLSLPARVLLGNKVPMIVTGTYYDICDHEASTTIDQYMVYFEKPLNYTAVDKDAIDLYDQTQQGDVAPFNVTELFTVTECWGNNTNKVYPFEEMSKLQKQYCVEEPYFNMTQYYDYMSQSGEWYTLDDAKTNFNKNGGIDEACNTKLSDLTDADGNPKYFLLWNGKIGAEGKIVFFQAAAYGATEALSKTLKIEVPVYLPGKFFLTNDGENKNLIKSTLKVNVNPKQTAKPAKK